MSELVATETVSDISIHPIQSEGCIRRNKLRSCIRAFLLMLTSLLNFTLAGPFVGGHLFSFTPLIGVVYMIGGIPAAFAGALFGASLIYIDYRTQQLPNDNGWLRGLYCGLAPILIFAALTAVQGDAKNDGMAGVIVFFGFSCAIAGTTCGALTMLLLRLMQR
ncbi:hypothetical protein HCH_00690 [Hahella chejuensis KCTC 2396]|uniref:Uncharacterized protein n=1 Tax=Hahella chejuensis (strain KCTC 2396) TaxID=349521 RepID=Q2SP35_HAHCH|nr:hypothetical protein [Hahella chejuensis]ABC27589.1 hypothetical protein HCH_00690 [Hahella chejuensis KCTC 2396]